MEDEKYKKAKKRVQEIKNFYIHLTVYLVVMVIIVTINLTAYTTGGPDYDGWNFQFLYPFGFWGFAVLMHGLKTFVFGPGSSWEQRKIKEVMKKMD